MTKTELEGHDRSTEGASLSCAAKLFVWGRLLYARHREHLLRRGVMRCAFFVSQSLQ